MRRRTLIVLAVLSCLLSACTQLVVNDLLISRSIRERRHVSGLFPSVRHKGMEISLNGYQQGFGYERSSLGIWRMDHEAYMEPRADGPLAPPPSESDVWLVGLVPAVLLNRLSQTMDDPEMPSPPAIVAQTRIGWPALAYKTFRYRSSSPSGRVQVYESATVKLPLLRNESPLTPVYPGAIVNALAYWFVVFVSLALPSQLTVITTRRLRKHRGRCPRCAYDLRGDTDAGCPECGWNRETNAESRVPRAD